MVLDWAKQLPAGKMRRRTRRKVRKIVYVTIASLLGIALMFAFMFMMIG